MAGTARAQVIFYIDSGADITLIPHRVGKALGFTQTKRDVVRRMKGISGASVPYIIKNVVLQMNSTRLEIRVAWALVDKVPTLLGRLDIFDRFVVAFDQRNGLVTFQP